MKPQKTKTEDQPETAPQGSAVVVAESVAGEGLPQGYVLEEQIGNLIRRAHQRATAIFLGTIGDGQVTPTQYAALVKLYEAGELSQNHLGRLTAMDPATIQGVIRRLTLRKLISHRPDKSDRRRRYLSLTPLGREQVERLAKNGPLVTQITLAPLPPAEQAQLVALLKKIV
ncbi:MarR family winged helix-turn-helix transcriptional regulator [Ferrovibrio sp.]|uniref:MarR family winged helix-turn-helix transcriptional regulator n=1 Tax=Ferrovibrio sp. TaxID=1917215 RepID=UPI0025C25247|nr:MarR family winged helix-turn-helix transcriptional regulator [Ferrovibrio sp.]MBX3454739.1 winged helix-turn-helix transcriptional regulator [Ferrovibrio sp.]